MSEEEAQANGEDKTATEATKTSYDGAEIRGARKEEEPEKRAGYDPVDVEKASPEQIKERINYLYRQVKDGNKINNQYRQVAAEQSRQIEELTKGFNGVVSHLQGKNFTDSEEAITAQMNEAFAKGDNKGYLDAQKKLINLGVEKRIAAEKIPAPKQATQTVTTTQQYGSASQIARDAGSEGELSSEEVRLTEAWQNEKDENGNLLRPWSKTADMNNPDPEFTSALREAQAVFTSTRFQDKPYEEKLAEVDRRMGLAKRTVSQTVSGGGLTGKSKSPRITLSSDIEKLAIRSKFGGPKAKTDAEHIEAYRKQIAKVKSANGARQ